MIRSSCISWVVLVLVNACGVDISLRMMRWMQHYLLNGGGDMPSHELNYELEAESAASKE